MIQCRYLSKQIFLIYSQLLGIILAVVAIYVFYTHKSNILDVTKLSLHATILFLVFLIFSIFAHEFVHYLSFTLFNGVPRKSVVFKINYKALVPYVVCCDKVRARRYMIAAILPFILFGLSVFIVSVIFNNEMLFWLSVFQINGSSNDILLFVLLIGFKNDDMVERTVGNIGFKLG